MAGTPELRLYAVSSGWDGPFQHEEVLVAAAGAEEAARRAEDAFDAVRQPVCRAKMLVADLGALAPDMTVGPRRSGESLAAGGQPIDRRCGVEAG